MFIEYVSVCDCMLVYVYVWVCLFVCFFFFLCAVVNVDETRLDSVEFADSTQSNSAITSGVDHCFDNIVIFIQISSLYETARIDARH